MNGLLEVVARECAQNYHAATALMPTGRTAKDYADRNWESPANTAAAERILSAIRAAGPTDAMVEAGARMLCQMDGDNPDDKSPFLTPEGTSRKMWTHFEFQARAMLTAALSETAV